MDQPTPLELRSLLDDIRTFVKALKAHIDEHDAFAKQAFIDLDVRVRNLEHDPRLRSPRLTLKDR